MADELIKKLELIPFPNHTGFFFKDTYRSTSTVKPLSYERDQRCFLTTLYFLAKKGEYGGWRRLKSDESFYYHRGGSIRIATINADGKLDFVTVGDALTHKDAVFHYTIPSNTWFSFGLSDIAHEEYGLVGIGVSPGFDIADVQEKDAAQLGEEFPQHKSVIEEFSGTMK